MRSQRKVWNKGTDDNRNVKNLFFVLPFFVAAQRMEIEKNQWQEIHLGD